MSGRSTSRIEETVREIGRTGGVPAVMRALTGTLMGALAIEVPDGDGTRALIPCADEHRALIEAAIAGGAGSPAVAKLAKAYAADQEREDDDPLKLGRTGDPGKVVYYGIAALIEPVADTETLGRHRRPAQEGYAVAMLQALERARVGLCRTQDERRQVEAEILGAVKQAAVTTATTPAPALTGTGKAR